MNKEHEEIDEELMKVARKIVKKKSDFLTNVVCFAAVNTMLIFIWYITGAGYFWPIWCMLGWGVGLAVMAADVIRYTNARGNYDKVEQEYQKLKRQSNYPQ